MLAYSLPRQILLATFSAEPQGKTCRGERKSTRGYEGKNRVDFRLDVIPVRYHLTSVQTKRRHLLSNVKEQLFARTLKKLRVCTFLIKFPVGWTVRDRVATTRWT